MLTLPRTVTLSKLVEQLKTSSSKWLKSKSESLKQFAWQSGYGAFSVSESQAIRVRQYIQDQEIHHKKAGFQDEIIHFLKASNMDFDPKYLFD
ncbi:MAG: transposase [Myxococcaceae bacterium]